MKTINLKKLTLMNYRNIEFAIYEFDGNSKIVGENRIGKTNTLESIYYLLTDYLLGGDSDVAKIKPLDDTKKVVSVEGLFEVIDDNGTTTQVIIKKEYKENWVKTRGTSEMILKGHDTTYYFNGVKQSTLKAYNQLVQEAFDLKLDNTLNIDFQKMLVDPFYLGNMGESKDWSNLRAFIIKLVGDVNDNDVFNKNSNLLPIKDDIERVGGKIDLAKKQYSQTISSLKEQIMQDDAKISLLESTAKPTDDEVAVARKIIDEHDTNIANLRNANGIDEQSRLIEKQLNEVKTQIADERFKIIKANSDSPVEKRKSEIADLISKKTDEQTKLSIKKHELDMSLYKKKYNIDNINSKIEDCSAKRNNLITQLRKIDEDIANAENTIETECPYCHQSLPKEKITETLNNLVISLQDKKAKLIKEGKENNEVKDKLLEDLKVETANVETINNELENCDKEIDVLQKDIDGLEKERNQLSSITITNLTSPELDELLKKSQKLESDLQASKIAFANNTQDINSRIYEEQKAKEPYNKILADLDYYNRQRTELENVQFIKDKHCKELINFEQKRELLNVFIKTKLEMLNDNVAKVFGNIKFQLIQENINGGYDTICKAFIYNVDKNESTKITWKSGSKSERVITGLAILEKIKQHLGLPNLPILFDEGGEISTDTFNTKFKTNSQLICVKVQDGILEPTIIKIN